MKLLIAFGAAAALTMPLSIAPCGVGSAAQAQGFACCKVCRAGKACGDSCIARNKECHKGPGCACNA